jgi:hypothetical protein
MWRQRSCKAGIVIPKECRGIAVSFDEADTEGRSRCDSGTLRALRPTIRRAFVGVRCAQCELENISTSGPERELYNQDADPQAAHNLASSSKAVADTVGSQLDDFRAKTSQTLVDLAKPDAAQMQKLQALGYVASDSAETKDSQKLSGTDPKAKIEVSNLLHDAMFDVEDARYEEAIPLLKKLADSGLPVANMRYDIAQARLKNYAEAVGPLQKAVKLIPTMDRPL